MAVAEGGAPQPAALDPRLPLRGALVGALAGLVGGSYRWLLDHIRQWDVALLGERDHLPAAWLLVCVLFASLAALSRWLTVRLAPDAAGSGIPQVEETLAGESELPHWHRLLPVKFVAGALALAGGLSLGREGPTVHLGAAIASGLRRGLARVGRRTLLAAGAAAGLTAAFSAPIAGFVFVLEELRVRAGRPMVVTVLPAVLASYLVTTAVLGAHAMFPLPAVTAPRPALLPLFVALGLAAGMVGVAFNRTLLWTLRAFDRFAPRPVWLGAALVGAGAGLLALVMPEVLGSGEHTTAAIVREQLPWSVAALAALLAVKLCFTAVSYGCGVPGGIFAPQLVMGAVLGAIVHALAPDLGQGLLPVVATAGMAGVFSASVRAPLTGLVLVVELTHTGYLLLPQATTALVAYLFAAAVRDKPIYEALRERMREATD